MEEVLKFINIEENSRIPKYQQIVDSIIHNICIGNLMMDQKIPSINNFSEVFYLSRDTVEKAYGILKDRNVITSIRGKGFYINRTSLISKINVMFLINKLSSHKTRIHNEFVIAMGPKSHIDLHVYHCDESLFVNLINKFKSAYDYYVVMPHFKNSQFKHVSSSQIAQEAMKLIPEDKLVILDNKDSGVKGNIVEIYQDYENDIYNALKKGLEKIVSYEKIILAFPTKLLYPYPLKILNGFKKFCVEFNLDFEIIDTVYEDILLKRGDLFIIIEESDLVNLMKQIRYDEFELGKDIGVISYNDTPLKELLGITCVSTDFQAMAKQSAEMILNNKKGSIKNPFNFIDRKSL